MNNRLFKLVKRVFLVAIGPVIMTACNPEPNEADLYTFTGETIESFIAKDSTLTAFNYILKEVGYDKMMAAYGHYTCYAPTNDGVYAYCDSLYNDEEATIPHNGMRKPESATYGDDAYSTLEPEERLKWLGDSLCLNIARFHLTTTYQNVVTMTGLNVPVNTMLGYNFTCNVNDEGNIILNNKAVIVSSDNETINGLVHVVDNVIPRFTRFIGDLLNRDGRFEIFAKALEVTGWADSLKQYKKDGDFTFVQRVRENYNSKITAPTECRVGFTLFAETDEVIKNALRQKGYSEDFNGLVDYANEIYGNAPQWYDYMRENGLTVNTDKDEKAYKEKFNALNMFVAYHILGCSMMPENLVFSTNSTSSFRNYKPDADPHDYYETKLPHTMMKIWQPVSAGTRSLFINRYQTFNTLTNEVGTQGTNHTLIRRGVQVDNSKGSYLEAFNGYVNLINSMLVYDELVPRGVLNERMRVNCTSLFPELITSGVRYWDSGDGNIPSQYDGTRYGLPYGFCDNVKFYNNDMTFVYCLRGNWRAYQADQVQFWGNIDLAYRLPSVPSGLYELRVIYAPLDYGAFMQYYIGTSSDITSMQAFGLPVNQRIAPEDPLIGWSKSEGDNAAVDDRGIASDVAMHNRGYMRAPYSFCGHGNSWSTENNCRVEAGKGTMVIRYVIGRTQLNQGKENWLRLKTLDENTSLLCGIDFIEIVPVSVVDHQEYTEDWY